MKLTSTTLSVLKNYATIQANLVVEAGNTLKTIAEARNVMSTCTLDQDFPQGFGLYDLPEFLSVIGLVDEPSLEFQESFVVVTDSVGRSRIKYFFSSPEILTSPTKDIKMPSSEVNFSLDEGTLNKIRRASSALGHDKMTIKPSDGSVLLSVVDSNDSTSNSFSIEVPGSYNDGEDFCFVLSIDNMKLLPGDYDVAVSSKLLSQFTNEANKISYFVALEKSSTYTGA